MPTSQAALRRGPGRAIRAALVGLGLLTAAPESTSAQATATTLSTKVRSFRIPFQVAPEDRARLKLVRLSCSTNGGQTWEPTSQTTPDKPSFPFRAPKDGEYWFAVQTLDEQGRVHPPADAPIEPSLKVIVDSVPPALVLDARGRRGPEVAVGWDVHDEHLDLDSFTLEYRRGTAGWRPLPGAARELTGEVTWDAGGAGPVTVRARVLDRAKNVREVTIEIPGEAGAAAAELPPNDDDDLNDPQSLLDAAEGRDRPDPGRRLVSDRQPTAPLNPPTESDPPAAPIAEDPFGDQGPPGAFDPKPPGDDAWDMTAPPSATRPVAPKLVVEGPRFPLKYEVTDAGPEGPAVVELWATRDGGRTWSAVATDPDKTSPFLVDLKGEGLFGLRIAARSASGLGDRPPVAGDAPEFVVEVDTTPPLILLNRPEVGTGPNAGKLAITWRANDAHLGSPCVLLSWRPESGGDDRWTRIAPPLENTGKYIWVIPPEVPDRIHVRIDVIDSLRHRSFADTTGAGPLVLDRTRPRGRIIGLDGPEAGPGATATIPDPSPRR